MGKIFVWTINLLLIALLAQRIIETDNDKSIVVFTFFYVALVGFNFLFWMLLSLSKRPLKDQMAKTIFGLVILFIPLLIWLVARE